MLFLTATGTMVSIIVSLVYVLPETWTTFPSKLGLTSKGDVVLQIFWLFWILSFVFTNLLSFCHSNKKAPTIEKAPIITSSTKEPFLSVELVEE